MNIERIEHTTHHRDTEDTENAQRVEWFSLCLASRALCVSVVNINLRKRLLEYALAVIAAFVLPFSSTSYAQTTPKNICPELASTTQPTSAPPAIKPEDQPVRVLVFGDFGDGSKRQKKVSEAMETYHRTRGAFDFGITLGDNFYATKILFGVARKGLDSPTHPWWDERWGSLYDKLGIWFYVALGNHDYSDNDPNAEFQRTTHPLNRSWCLPAAYYTYTAGPVQFFALDTNKGKLTKTQLDWLDRELNKSRARWKVAYGHHPIKSDGAHRNDAYIAKVRAFLLNHLQNKVDVYLAGHEHDLEYLKPEGDVQLYISGGGGKDPRSRKFNPVKVNRKWGMAVNGFTVLDIDTEKLVVTFIDEDGKQLCQSTLRKGQQVEDACPDPP